jgi:hypothetical protein
MCNTPYAHCALDVVSYPANRITFIYTIVRPGTGTRWCVSCYLSLNLLSCQGIAIFCFDCVPVISVNVSRTPDVSHSLRSSMTDFEASLESLFAAALSSRLLRPRSSTAIAFIVVLSSFRSLFRRVGNQKSMGNNREITITNRAATLCAAWPNASKATTIAER